MEAQYANSASDDVQPWGSADDDRFTFTAPQDIDEVQFGDAGALSDTCTITAAATQQLGRCARGAFSVSGFAPVHRRSPVWLVSEPEESSAEESSEDESDEEDQPPEIAQSVEGGTHEVRLPFRFTMAVADVSLDLLAADLLVQYRTESFVGTRSDRPIAIEGTPLNLIRDVQLQVVPGSTRSISIVAGATLSLDARLDVFGNGASTITIGWRLDRQLVVDSTPESRSGSITIGNGEVLGYTGRSTKVLFAAALAG